jgi:microsomal dipeptidase-like Zn-dependent dipeptidase
VTLAHLLWREVATDAPALPFLTDAQYRRLFPQPEVGLSELGAAAVRALVAHGVLVDVAHMSERALADTFALLDELDPGGTVPLVASHCGVRFGTQEYMLARASVEQIAARDGVVGLIFATHQLEDGLSGSRPRRRVPATRSRRFERGLGVLCEHVDALHELTGSHRHTAIGSDLDGFIKPTLPGLQDMRDMARLQDTLLDRYGPDDGQAICSGNALRVLGHWRGAAAT